jgi:hypothetical protein
MSLCFFIRQQVFYNAGSILGDLVCGSPLQTKQDDPSSSSLCQNKQSKKAFPKIVAVATALLVPLIVKNVCSQSFASEELHPDQDISIKKNGELAPQVNDN